MPKIKNILIFSTIGVIFILIYVFFIKSPAPETSLVSSPSDFVIPGNSRPGPIVSDGTIARDFLILLLSVKNIKLDDKIFSDDAFASLHDSSITLIPDGNEGRPNPFAPLGTENTTSPEKIPSSPTPITNTPAPKNI